jgi:hypothetical protein
MAGRRLFHATFGLLVAVVCGVTALPGRCLAGDVFYFISGPQSYVGAGQTKTYDSSLGANISVGRSGNTVQFFITQGSDDWDLFFGGPGKTLATAGDYPDAQRWPFESGLHPGLSFTGEGRGDNQLIGSFNVLAATFDGSGNVTAYAADFVQYDEGNLSWWNIGSIRYHSNLAVIPEPGTGLLAGVLTGFWALRWRPRRCCHNGNPICKGHS